MALDLKSLMVLAILSLAYRLRGWGGFLLGTFTRRLFWAVIIGAAGFFLGALWWQSVAMSIGAFAGMWIQHGKYYTVENTQQAVSMAAIGGARMVLMLWWSPMCGLASIASMALTPLGYWIGVRIARRLRMDEMWFAEPIVGLLYGLILSLIFIADDWLP